MNALSVNGHWTVQLKNDGNFEGESPNPTGSVFGDYPEMLSLARSAPDGRLDDFQRSKVRVWADYRADARPVRLAQHSRRSIATTRREPTASC